MNVHKLLFVPHYITKWIYLFFSLKPKFETIFWFINPQLVQTQLSAKGSWQIYVASKKFENFGNKGEKEYHNENPNHGTFHVWVSRANICYARGYRGGRVSQFTINIIFICIIKKNHFVNVRTKFFWTHIINYFLTTHFIPYSVFSHFNIAKLILLLGWVEVCGRAVYRVRWSCPRSPTRRV